MFEIGLKTLTKITGYINMGWYLECWKIKERKKCKICKMLNFEKYIYKILNNWKDLEFKKVN